MSAAAVVASSVIGETTSAKPLTLYGPDGDGVGIGQIFVMQGLDVGDGDAVGVGAGVAAGAEVGAAVGFGVRETPEREADGF